MRFKYFVLVALLLGILSNALAIDFYDGMVENYGIGTNTVGEVWSGCFDDEPYTVLEAEVEIVKAVPVTYNEWVVEATKTFTNEDEAPIWDGFYNSTGSFDLKQSMSIKMLAMGDYNYWEEIPSQISVRTKCFGPGGSFVECSPAYYRVKELYIDTLRNITTDENLKVAYLTEFCGAYSPKPEAFIKFVFNDTTGNFVYYYDDEAVYPTRVWYYNTNRTVYTDYGMYIDFDSTWQVTTLAAPGTPQGSDCDIVRRVTGNVFGCYSGTMKLSSVTATQDMGFPIFAEMRMASCNFAGTGPNSGSLELDVTPMYMRHKIYRIGTTTGTFYVPKLEALVCGGMQMTHTGESAAYVNLTNSAYIGFPIEGNPPSINTTSTSFGLRNYVGFTCDCSGICSTSRTIYPNPFIIKLKDTMSDMSTINAVYGHGGHTYNPIIANRWVNPGDNQRMTSWIALFQISSLGGTDCSYVNTVGFSDESEFFNIIGNETFGGMIQANEVDFNSVCLSDTADYCGTNSLRCDPTTKVCVADVGLDIYSCSDDDKLIYVDECDVEHSCKTCGDMCNEYSNYITCGDYCIGEAERFECGADNNQYLVTSCGTVLNMNCTSGQCSRGNCVGGVTSTLYTFDYSTAADLGQVSLNITSGSGNTTVSVSTGVTGIANVNLPVGVYNITASKTGYITQIATIAFDTAYRSGCAKVEKGKAYAPCQFGMKTTTAASSSSICIKVEDDIGDPVLGADVNMTLGGVSHVGATGLRGEYYDFDTDSPCAYFDLTNGTVNIAIFMDGYTPLTDSFFVNSGVDYYKTYTMTATGGIDVSGNSENGESSRFLNGKAMVTITPPITGTMEIVRQDVVAYRCGDLGCQTYKPMTFLQPVCTEGRCPQDVGVAFAGMVADRDPINANIDESSRGFLMAAKSIFDIMDIVVKPTCSILHSAFSEGAGFSDPCYAITFGDKILFNPTTSGEVPKSLYIGMNEIPYEVNIEGIGTATAYAIKNFADNSTAVCSQYGIKSKLFVPGGFTRFTTDYLIFAMDSDQYMADFSDRNEYSLTINGVKLEGTRMELKTNGLYRSYLRRGYLSYGWGAGYEASRFVKPITSMRVTAGVPIKLKLDENEVNGDVYAKIKKHNYASIEPGYGDEACQNLALDDSNFKVVTTMSYIIRGDDGNNAVVNAPVEGSASNVDWFAPSRIAVVMMIGGPIIIVGVILVLGLLIIILK
jgi:hypothetical protein